MFLFLYLDEDSCSDRLIAALRKLMIDVMTATEMRLLSIADTSQLEFALSQGRPILSGNYKDFAPMQSAWAAQGREHPGIILWNRERWRPEALAAALYEICSSRTQEQFRNTIIWL